MKRKLNRILRPGMGIYFITMLAFSLVTLLMDRPAIAAGEALITVAMYTAYVLLRKLRHRNLLRYLEKNHETVESAGKGKSPFPTVVTRLSDGSIIWANDLFAKITGFSDLMTEQVDARVEEIVSKYPMETDFKKIVLGILDFSTMGQ